MSGEHILFETRVGSLARLTLNRPAARNSLSVAMLEQLHDGVLRLGETPDVHVIILSGTGPAFCAGHDLRELTAARLQPDKGQSFFQETMSKCSQLMTAIVHCPKPVIAQVHGIATAAGAQLVASCDLAVAERGARFATPGVNIGLFCSTPMVALSRNVSRKAAMELLLTGEMIEADEARRIGLINRIAETGSLEEVTEDLAAQIASKAPATLRIGKEAFYRQIEMPLTEAYSFASQVMSANMMLPDAEEGISAFLEKREANWQR